MNGALLIDKHEGVSSFGIIEMLQHDYMERNGVRRRDVPKLGHGGTLDPFATGLLAVCAGRAVKLARYFLGATKVYEGVIRFGETTVPGDPTAPISERAERVPESIEEVRAMALQLSRQPYLQTPPMHSAKKKDGKPLYELARQGIVVEREPKLCTLYSFEILSFEKDAEAKVARASFRVTCSSGTYVRTLAQDFGRLLGSVAMLDSLRRTVSGAFHTSGAGHEAWTVERIREATAAGKRWDELPCWMPFDQLLAGYESAEATPDERNALFQGRQNVLFNILKRAGSADRPLQGHEDCLAIYSEQKLVAIARRENGAWGLERVFTPDA